MYANAPKLVQELLLESIPTLTKEMHCHYYYNSLFILMPSYSCLHYHWDKRHKKKTLLLRSLFSMYTNALKSLKELLLESVPTLNKEMHWHYNYISYCIVSSNSFLDS